MRQAHGSGVCLSLQQYSYIYFLPGIGTVLMQLPVIFISSARTAVILYLHMKASHAWILLN